jgi:hypothetical protein
LQFPQEKDKCILYATIRGVCRGKGMDKEGVDKEGVDKEGKEKEGKEKIEEIKGEKEGDQGEKDKCILHATISKHHHHHATIRGVYGGLPNPNPNPNYGGLPCANNFFGVNEVRG